MMNIDIYIEYPFKVPHEGQYTKHHIVHITKPCRFIPKREKENINKGGGERMKRCYHYSVEGLTFLHLL